MILITGTSARLTSLLVIAGMNTSRGHDLLGMGEDRIPATTGLMQRAGR